MQAADRKSTSWPLESLCPAPSSLSDAAQRLSAFADRLASEYQTSPEAVTRKRMQALADACAWSLTHCTWTKEPSRPRIVDQASIMLGMKVESVEEDRSSNATAGLF